MSTSPRGALPRARTIEVTEAALIVGLVDGRTITTPLNWFPRLLNASPEARTRWELIGVGEGIRWPDADEDLSVEGLLMGTRARR